MDSPLELKVERYVFRVGELTRAIKEILEEGFPFLWVEGEISNLKDYSSGHLYFTLKDEEAALKAVVFRTHRAHLRFDLENGLHVLCFGRLSVYEPRGEYQLLVQNVEPLGYGSFQLALRQLKKRLAAKGYFDEKRKKTLPLWPRCVGVVTSPDGAALRDFLRVGLSRHPRASVLIYPVRVQGEGAAEEIAQGIRTLARWPEVEVIVVTRGGGSWEDLMAFNTEIVAKAIYESEVPVVSAVGHEIDVTICDLVADLRVPTPTAAAQVVFPDLSQLVSQYLELKGRLERAFEARLKRCRKDLSALLSRLKDPTQKIKHAQRRHQELCRRLQNQIQAHLNQKKERLQACFKHLHALSPLNVLARGYSITRLLPEGRILHQAHEARPGDRLEILLHQGKLLARVEEVRDET